MEGNTNDKNKDTRPVISKLLSFLLTELNINL